MHTFTQLRTIKNFVSWDVLPRKVPPLTSTVSHERRQEVCFYFYRCTVHFEDSLSTTHQQMH